MWTRVHYVHMYLKGQKTTWMQSLSCHLPHHFWRFPEQEPNSYWKGWQSKRRQRIQRIELLRKIFWKRECLLWFAEHLFLNNSGRSLQNLSECVLTVHGSVKALVPMQIPLSLPSESFRRCVVFTNTHILSGTCRCVQHQYLSLSYCLSSFSPSISHSCVEEGLGLRKKDLSVLSVQHTRQYHQTHKHTQQHCSTFTFKPTKMLTKNSL